MMYITGITIIKLHYRLRIFPEYIKKLVGLQRWDC